MAMAALGIVNGMAAAPYGIAQRHQRIKSMK
jgi:hypothetical protein